MFLCSLQPPSETTSALPGLPISSSQLTPDLDMDTQILASFHDPGKLNGLHTAYVCGGSMVMIGWRVIVWRFFGGGHSDQCEVIPHCSFEFHCSNN